MTSSRLRVAAVVGVLGIAVSLTVALFKIPSAAATGPVFVQSGAISTGSRVLSANLGLTKPVAAGDLLVGWFAEYNAAGQVKVADSVNGAWTRSATSISFRNGTGDIALYYVAQSSAAASGVTVTVSGPSSAYLQAAAADYTGFVGAAPVQVIASRAVGTAVDSGATAAVPAGSLVYAAVLTGGSPGGVTPGSSQGVPYTQRARTSSGSSSEEDITASAAGVQHGTATLAKSTDWYAVVAVFATTTTSPSPTSTPTPSPTTTSATPTPSPTTTSSTPTPTSTTASPTPTSTMSTISFAQGATIATGTRVTSATVTLPGAVQGGDLLVAWVSEYDALGHAAVSDPVNGGWTRAPSSMTFQNDSGDIALYYLSNAAASAAGSAITITAPAPAYVQGVFADYHGLALAGALDTMAAGRGVGTAVDTGPTAKSAAGDLVFAALITGGSPSSVSPGTSGGVAYTPRASTSSGSVYAEDITSGTSASQNGTATLGTSTDWYAAVATFHAATTAASGPPPAPTALYAASVATTRAAVAWQSAQPSGGFTVFRDGQQIATVDGSTLRYLDTTVAAASTYQYSVDAFDSSNQHSQQSAQISVVTPSQSPQFVQGVAASPGFTSTSQQLTLTRPIAQGDLLVGWFGQWQAAGQVSVADNVNGPWTRSVSETFSNGAGDIALEYVEDAKPAATGITITVSASSPAYLQEAIADFSGTAATGSLAQALVSRGGGASVSGPQTAAVPSGDLVIAGLITGGQPATLTAGASQNVPWSVDTANGSYSTTIADILSSAVGPQTYTAQLGTGTDWYLVEAVFKPR